MSHLQIFAKADRSIHFAQQFFRGMSDDDANITLRCLIETEIPEGRANLESSSINLERVATYCEANYAQAADKRAAFSETKQYLVQSMASVAYQVNTMACGLLQTLHLQEDKVNKMVLQVDKHLTQTINVNKEKAARREIGMLTINKCILKQPKIIPTLNMERPARYQSTTIDYSVLDGLGHGVKSVEPSLKLGSRSTSTTSGYNSGNYHPVFPNYEQLLPKAHFTSTLSRSSSSRGDHYRTPHAAPTPLIDPQRFSSVTHTTNYSVISNSSNYGSTGIYLSTRNLPLPPPQLASVEQYRISGDMSDEVTPPQTIAFDDDPLPPPPIAPSVPSICDGYLLNSSNAAENRKQNHCDLSYGPSVSNCNLSDWNQRTVMEKAIALYDYEAEKPDELSLRENCIVYILRKNDDGWFEGILDNCTGLFPGNYVQILP